MMKLLVLTMLFLSCILFAEANQSVNYSSFGFDLKYVPFTEALSGTYTVSGYLKNYSYDWNETLNESVVSFGAYLDFTYINISVSYCFNPTPPTASASVGSYSNSLTGTGYTDTFFQIGVFLKYPFALSENILSGLGLDLRNS